MSLGKQRVNLLDEFKGSVLLVKDQGVDVINQNWDFTLLEKQLQLLPVVLLLRVVFGIIERVHLDLAGEVAREDLSDEETVVKSSSDVFDGV